MFPHKKAISVPQPCIPKLFIAASLVFPCLPALAETLFSAYTGSSFARDSDLRITRPGAGTELTLHDVQWDAQPFKLAPYYGLRVTRFLDRYPAWGLALDFTHYKMVARTGQATGVDGTWNGAAVHGTAPIDRYVQHFEMSHGVNMLSINGLYRWRGTGSAGEDSASGGRLQPYVGAGLAYYLPHSENTVDNIAHETGYEHSGFGYQLLGGVQYRISDRFGVFAEVKYNSGTATVGIADGQAETRLRTFHALFGVSVGF